MSGALWWLGRTAVLVFSLLATLSIIGSIAAIPSGSVEGRLGLPAPSRDASRPEVSSRQAPAEPLQPEMPQPGPGADQMIESITIPAAPPQNDLLRWLEPLTYAAIALAGLMAVAVLLLWRILIALDARR